MRRLVRVMMMLVLSAGALHAQTAQRKVQYGAKLNDRGYLRIWNLAGSTRITGWDRDSVVVRGSAPAGQEFRCGGSVTAMKCAVNAMGMGDTNAPATLEVMVPRHIQLWIKSATADITVASFDGSVDAYSVSGTIRVDGNGQAFTLESMAGNLIVPASSATLRAKTASGDIVVTGAVEDVEATSVSGNLRIAGARFERGRFESIDGDVRWEGAPADGASLQFGSHSGKIELLLPATTRGDFTVSTFQGTVQNDFSSGRLVQGRDLNGRELHFQLRGDESTRIVIRNFKGRTILTRS